MSDSTDFRAKCHKCQHVFSLCELPAEISVFAAVVNKAFCPNCKAGPRHIYLAAEPVSPPVAAPAGPHWQCVGEGEYQALYKNRTLSVSRNSWIVYLASLSSVAHGFSIDTERAKAAAKAWVDG